ncbi:MAG: hypothetical protein EBS06_07890 [Proteobacteria bacterium]|nr:hypothetical protein [Pseudomonadota bacterium]
MKNKILIILAVTALTFASSCGKNKKPAEVTNNNLSNLPSWVLDPNMPDGVAAVGIASPSKGGIKFQIPAAELDAKANIAATIQSEISRVTKDSLRSANVNNSDDVEQFFAQASKEVVKNLPLSGVKRINIFQANDGTLYVHMILKNEDYSKFLNDSEKSLNSQLKKSALGRENIKKSEEASKAIFDELEKERGNKSVADKTKSE